MNSKRFIICTLLAFGSISLASCRNNQPTPEPEPVVEKATITVINGTGGGSYDVGSTVTITADEISGKEFKEWQVNSVLVSTLNPYSFIATESQTYTAVYNEVSNKKVLITVVNGTGSGTYTIGDEVSVSPFIPENKIFDSWTVDGQIVSELENYVFVAEEDLVIIANFKAESKMAKYTRTITMTGDEFKILNLTDIQLHDGNNLVVTKKVIDELVEYKKPDMIVILGDIMNDNSEYDSKNMPKEIFDLIESYDIPWAPLFGNHDQADLDPGRSKKSIGSQELSEMLLNPANNYEHCLYLNGPEDVDGLSNYMINIKNSSGKLVESLILLDSLKFGVNSTHISFYEDCVNYAKELNHGTIVPSVLFDHIPLPQYVDEFERFSKEEYTGINGCCATKPVSNNASSEMFPKMKELGSTKTMICGHDHFNSYYTEVDGIKLAYAMKTSDGDDEGGNPYKYYMGGCYLTIDGVNDKIEYHPVNNEYTVEANTTSGFDFHITPCPNWKGSGAKLKFDIDLSNSGTLKFDLMGTNLLNEKADDAIGNWNRLTDYININATEKTVNAGTLTLVKDNLYTYEADLMDLSLNLTDNLKSCGDETVRAVYFFANTMDFTVSNIHLEYEEITETDQIDLSSAVITPIEDQLYLKGSVIKPNVEVKLNGNTLTHFSDYIVNYKNNRELGTANVIVTPSGKGAHHYKGSVSTTFNIVGNPWRGTAFEAGYQSTLDDIPLTETFEFDIHFTSGSNSTIWFFIGKSENDWTEYFGYYGLNANGTLVDNYPGISVAPTSDEYVRVTCVLSNLITKHASAVPTDCIDLFYIRGDWGNSPTGYIDFNLSDVPEVVRGESFTANEDKTISFDKMNYDETLVVDFKFTSGEGTHLNFFVGNSIDGWSHYFGYYKFTQAGVLDESEADKAGISITTTADGYYRLTFTFTELTKQSKNGKPNTEQGFNLFYIRGVWTTASGYVDFNPQV